MGRRRVTEFLPFLLPLRRKQKIAFFYWKMKWDRNHYTKTNQDELLPFVEYQFQQGLINPDSGYDMQYQINKVHNLKVASKKMRRLIIKPEEVFSFWQLARNAGKQTPYLPGLGLSDGKIVPVMAGGLCLLSELLYWMVLHTPLTVIEKHPHLVISLPANPNAAIPEGIDATIQEGWSDFKFKNETEQTFQLTLDFTDDLVEASFRCEKQTEFCYEVMGSPSRYIKNKSGIIRLQDIYHQQINRITQNKDEAKLLYTSKSKIMYKLDESIKIEESEK